MVLDPPSNSFRLAPGVIERLGRRFLVSRARDLSLGSASQSTLPRSVPSAFGPKEGGQDMRYAAILLGLGFGLWVVWWVGC